MQKAKSAWATAREQMQEMKIGESRILFFPKEKLQSIKAASCLLTGRFSFRHDGGDCWTATMSAKRPPSRRSIVLSTLRRLPDTAEFAAEYKTKNVAEYISVFNAENGTCYEYFIDDAQPNLIKVWRNVAAEACAPLMAACNARGGDADKSEKTKALQSAWATLQGFYNAEIEKLILD